MACPYFLPIEKFDGTWLHPQRLPLGCGWKGQCAAPGHEGEVPSDEELREFCNLGYAQGCDRLPRERAWDSVRFGARMLEGDEDALALGRIQIRYVCERDHRPAAQGTLVFDAQLRCEQIHFDVRLQKLAECFLRSYLERRRSSETEQAIT